MADNAVTAVKVVGDTVKDMGNDHVVGGAEAEEAQAGGGTADGVVRSQSSPSSPPPAPPARRSRDRFSSSANVDSEKGLDVVQPDEPAPARAEASSLPESPE